MVCRLLPKAEASNFYSVKRLACRHTQRHCLQCAGLDSVAARSHMLVLSNEDLKTLECFSGTSVDSNVTLGI